MQARSLVAPLDEIYNSLHKFFKLDEPAVLPEQPTVFTSWYYYL
jgi:hypothetical protein